MADLGSWLNGSYRISRPLDEQDLDEGIRHGAAGESDPEAEDEERRVRAPRSRRDGRQDKVN
jgi:hypothetical protein